MIRTHCPELADLADAQLQCVHDAIACWQRYCDVGELNVRGVALCTTLILTSSSERDD
jgi:hypothetical protein